MILAGDIGGTKTNVALFSWEAARPVIKMQRTFRTRDYENLEALVAAFVSSNREELTSACFGVPCPVIGGKCETPNLPWSIDLAALKQSLRAKVVSLINDLEAAAYGISVLEPNEFAVLNEGRPDPAGNCVLLAAGTGLGEALLFCDGERRLPAASEGGHADFAPRNELEIELLRHLQRRFGGHVSWERVLSGPGLFNIYQFLRDSGHGEEPAWLADRLKQDDPAAVISEAARSRQCELCVKALDLFLSLYGAEAGNLALKAMATGGVYIGGGIAPKIIGNFYESAFMKAFTDKGRLSPLLRNIPVKVVMNDKSALYGAALYAALAEQRATRPQQSIEQSMRPTGTG